MHSRILPIREFVSYQVDHLENEQALHDTSETCKTANVIHTAIASLRHNKLEHKMAPRDHHNLTLQGCSV